MSRRTQPRERRVNPWLQLFALFGVFTAGGFVGLGLASWAAPGSGVAAAISGVLLPAAFAGGLVVWAGLDIAGAVLGLVRGRARRPAVDLAPHARRWFVPLSLILTGPAGLVVGLLPGGQGVVASVVAYGAAGVVYGLLVSRLAAAGYLSGPHAE